MGSSLSGGISYWAEISRIMNRIVLTILMLLLVRPCMSEYGSDAADTPMHEAVPLTRRENSDTLKIDLAQSKIQWKATKLFGTRKHEGDVQLRHAYLLSRNGRVTGGHFLVTMKSLRVTDIPAHESVAETNLNNHLKSHEFFDVEKYPDAAFDITGVRYLTTDRINITGRLTIKNVTKSIEFAAVKKDRTFSGNVVFDRFQWNITYEGNLAERTLVDKNIELTIVLKIR
jgi:polyisoprenoid-binding protein YceI